MNQKRRFIAGAVCPKCAEMDRMVMFTDEQGTHRECVSCGFSDKLSDLESPQELATRVNQVDAPAPAPEVVPLKFYPRPKK
ncbi:MAG: YheV family putative metal-binding protein [Hahellaceae bacterium]|nr:YheV family putative metal-binding protein [Hahellaceae bacterium]